MTVTDDLYNYPHRPTVSQFRFLDRLTAYYILTSLEVAPTTLATFQPTIV